MVKTTTCNVNWDNNFVCLNNGHESICTYDYNKWFTESCDVTISWWRHQMETFSVLLAICAGNSPVSDEFPAQRPVTPSLDIFFDLRLNKQSSKQPWGWWFETLSCPLWRQCNDKFAARIIHKYGFISGVKTRTQCVKKSCIISEQYCID